MLQGKFEQSGNGRALTEILLWAYFFKLHAYLQCVMKGVIESFRSLTEICKTSKFSRRKNAFLTKRTAFRQFHKESIFNIYSTVTLLARLRGLSTSSPLAQLM